MNSGEATHKGGVGGGGVLTIIETLSFLIELMTHVGEIRSKP